MSIKALSSSYEDAFCQGTAFQQQLEAGAIDLFQRGQLYLFDPMAGNQCHLMAYRIALLYQQQQIDRPLLCSSLLVNSCFKREKKHIPAVANVTDVKGCSQFLTQTHACQTAERAVVRNICSYITREISRFPAEPLLQEVRGGDDGCVDKQEGPYPKFAGVRLLLQQLNVHPVPVVLKIKVLSESDHYIANFVVYHPDEPVREANADDEQRLHGQAVLAIEGLATHDAPVQMYLDSRGKCFHCLIVYSRTVQSRTVHSDVKRHARDAFCRHCLQGSEEGREQAVETACGPLKGIRFCELISAAGAAFTHEGQPEGHQRLMASAMRHDYEQSLQFAEEHLISVPGLPSICMVEHMYSDLGERALSMQRLVDRTPTEVRAAILQGGMNS